MSFNPLSTWFPFHVHPVRKGLYLTDADHAARCPELMLWTGAKWTYPNGQPTIYHDRVWCGLSFDPDDVAVFAWDEGPIHLPYAPNSMFVVVEVAR